jgi:predicted TIM-barrel fold metal-dependent hydrolase
MGSSRRGFLGGAVAVGVALCGSRLAYAQPGATERPRRGPVMIKGRRVKTVDMHAHLLVPEVWPLIEKYPQAESDIGAFLKSPMAARLTSVDARLATMERQGIDIQVLSLHFQHQHDWADRDLATAIVKLLNEKVAEQVAAHPDRFIGLGAVSLQHPDLAADQLAHAMHDLGLRGVMMTTLIGDEEISAERFAPFWSKAEELGAVVFVHPEGFTGADKRFAGAGQLANTIGMPLDTSVALSHMIFSGFLDKHPRAKIVLSHGGGFLPSYIGRADNCYARSNGCQGMAKAPSEYLKSLYYDTLVYSPENLRYLIDEVGASQLVLGTDYPFPIASQDPVGDALAVKGLSDDEREAILGGTALKLLGA